MKPLICIVALVASGCAVNASSQCLHLAITQSLHDARQTLYNQMIERGVESPDSLRAAYDSITPPITPREQEWYQNNCWRGQAR